MLILFYTVKTVLHAMSKSPGDLHRALNELHMYYELLYNFLFIGGPLEKVMISVCSTFT